jgi:hypothetical protein
VLREAKNASILPDQLEYIATQEVKDAYTFLVGAAAVSAQFQCHGELKGVVRGFRFYVDAEQQPFAFIVNRESLLFYFRSPAIRSRAFAFEELCNNFDDVSENKSSEWTVRITNLSTARRLWTYIDDRTRFRSGEGATTIIGYTNRNNQRCDGHRGKAGNDHLQRAYKMTCLEENCGHVYGANGTDVFQRKCPVCQNGQPSIEF